ncbi:MAG: single-stranded-DNA-specific exonuclease RecJ [Gammaproteobacteria bacterium]|nr:MAG: single-stranded-DNA-specific exonuclease RecJ [Gammaproteobacteria bacterium]
MNGVENNLDIKTYDIPTDSDPVHDNPIISNILLSRGIVDRKQADLGLASLSHYDTLPDIKKAVKIISLAIEHNKNILIIGDYDADGATSTSVAVMGLQRLGAKNVRWLIPARLTMGYGLNNNLLEQIYQKKPNLIITVDNGISATETCQTLSEEGIEVIITDHHLPPETLPNATAIVNPKLAENEFALSNLSGVGVMFYVLIALRAYLSEQKILTQKINLADLLSLVAIGTLADLVPMDKNNRILVHNGLLKIKNQQCPMGVLQICQIANINPADINSVDIGFKIAPNINAAGRIHQMDVAVECLISSNYETCNKKAHELKKLNNQRKITSSKMKDEAESQLIGIKKILNSHHDLFGICLYDESWHEGIIGIIAGKICEQMNLPVIIFTNSYDDNILRGSARSTHKINLKNMLDNFYQIHKDKILKYGGHAMAAGLSIKKDFLTEFSLLFNQECGKLLKNKSLKKEILTDGQLNPVNRNPIFVRNLQEVMPWGMGLAEPVFYDDFIVLSYKILQNKFTKMFIKDKNGSSTWNVIYFGGVIDTKKGDEITIVYKLSINNFYNKPDVQLIVQNYTLK